MTEIDITQKLNLETAKIEWAELQRHFARGSLIVVDQELDLIEVAGCFVEDRSEQVSRWQDEKRLRPAETDDARRWHEYQSLFWAVVVAPWVLVQEIDDVSIPQTH